MGALFFLVMVRLFLKGGRGGNLFWGYGIFYRLGPPLGGVAEVRGTTHTQEDTTANTRTARLRHRKPFLGFRHFTREGIAETVARFASLTVARR